MDEEFSDDGDEDGDEPKRKSREDAAKRKVRIEREKADLLRSLAADDISTLKTRVAMILNLVPNTRDSDVALALKYWAMFQPDIYNPAGIAPDDLFKLERLHYIVRVRAMIQNDYGLFVASQAIKNHRKRNEQSVKAEILAAQPERAVIKIYADETGKNGKYVMVASVWSLSVFTRLKLMRDIADWRLTSPFGKREMHFTELRKNDGQYLDEFLDIVARNSEFLSFKVIGIERSRTRRPISEVVGKLHEQMLKKGIEHEILSGRVSLPRAVDVTLDDEDTLDAIALAEMRGAVEAYLRPSYSVADLTIEEIAKADSKSSTFLQIADLVAGAVNRLRNHDGEPNFKDDYARSVADKLGIAVTIGEDEDLDSATFLRL